MKRLFLVLFTALLVTILLSSCTPNGPNGLSKEQRATNKERERGGACKQNAGYVGY